MLGSLEGVNFTFFLYRGSKIGNSSRFLMQILCNRMELEIHATENTNAWPKFSIWTQKFKITILRCTLSSPQTSSIIINIKNYYQNFRIY